MYHIFIHSSVDGHSGRFHVLAIVNSTAMNIGVHVTFRTMLFSACMPRSGIAGSCVRARVCACMCVHVCIKFLSRVWLSVTPWSVPRQAPYSWDCPDKNTGGGWILWTCLGWIAQCLSLVFSCFPTSVGCLSAGDKSPGNKDLSLIINSPLSSPSLSEHSLTQRHVIRNKLRQ